MLDIFSYKQLNKGLKIFFIKKLINKLRTVIYEIYVF